MHPLPLLLLLALSTVTVSQTYHFVNSPIAHSKLTTCISPGLSFTNTTITCAHPSCHLSFRSDLPYPTETTFSVLRSNKYLHHFHLPSSGIHETSLVTLPSGSYDIVLRAQNAHNKQVCGLITYALQRQFSGCQVVLPTILQPTPTPSTTPTPSRTPRPSSTPRPTPSRTRRPSSPPRPPPTPSTTPETDRTAQPSQTPLERQVTPRIVGGSIPHPSLRTHMVAFIAGGAFICSGSVISARWAITAAHCRVSSGMRASVGGATVSSGTFLTVQAAFPHALFDTGRTDSPYDIALILFADPVPDFTSFIRVNTNSSVPEPGAYARVAGYGQTFQKSAQTLRQVDLPVVSMPRCKSQYSRANRALARRLNPEIQVCAGLSEGGCDACQGDSGGPLALFDSGGHLVQIGVVSFGIGCARAGFPGVYTRLSAFEPWINEIGAGYTRSTDGVTVFSTGSAEAAGKAGGFSIAGLSTLQTILLLCGIALVAGILVFLGVAGIVKSRRRRSIAPAPPPPGESGRAYPLDDDGYGGRDGAWHAEGLYPVYGSEHQYAGYAQQPSYPEPAAREAEGFDEDVRHEIGETRDVVDAAITPAPTTNDPKINAATLYPSNTVLHD